MVPIWLDASETSLPAGELSLVEIQASIPEDAPYGSIQLLSLRDIQIDEGAVAAQCDGGVHVVAYIGDGTGNGSYSALDAAYIARVGVGLDSGFAAYPWKDPMLIGDVTGNGSLSALDAAYLARKGVGLEVPQIPDLPTGLPPIVPSGRDPLVSIPDDLTAHRGETLTVPVSILDDATDLFAVELYLEYDTAVFDLDTGDLRAGDLTAGWTMIGNIDDTAGTIVVHLFGTNPLSGGTGSVVEIDFSVRADAPYGPAALDLTDDCMLNDGDLVVTLDNGCATILADDSAPAASVVNAAALPGATAVANGLTVPHTAPSSTGSLGSVSGGSGRLSLGTYGGNNGGLLGDRLGVPELMVSNRPGWQAVNLQRPESAFFGQTIWLAWSPVGNPGIRFTAGTMGRADAGIGWSDRMPTSFGASTIDDYIHSIYANYL